MHVLVYFKVKSMVKAKQKQVPHNFSILYDWEISSHENIFLNLEMRLKFLIELSELP